MRWHCRWCGEFVTDTDGPVGRAQAADHLRLLHPQLDPVQDPLGWVDRTGPEHQSSGSRP